MRYIISGKNINVTEGLKAAIHDKIGKSCAKKLVLSKKDN